MKINPYLYFNGRCGEALEFYKQALGAEVKFSMKFKDNPQPQYNPPGSEEKIMHADFSIGESHLMASDGMCDGAEAKFNGVTLTLQVADAAEADRTFAALKEGGEVRMPLGETFFSPRFGMVADKFGVSWMVIVPRPM
ncbi:MAG: VOC family protein [Pirellulales bacterium]